MKRYTPWAVLLALLYFPILHHLERLPIRLWDESRLALNAWEMTQGGSWLVTTFGGQPDLWNTKPPLLIWLQVLGYELLGVRELAVRWPSVLAGIGMGVIVFYFLRRYFYASTTLMGRSLFAPFIAAIALVSFRAFTHVHMVRTGDYDALLMLFSLVYVLAFYQYTLTRSNRQIGWFFAGVTLAVMTKGVAGLLVGPGVLLYAILTRSLWPMLRSRATWIGVAAFVLVVGGYYYLREQAAPGYLQAVWQNELGGRFGSSLEGHQAPWWYYLGLWVRWRLAYWWLGIVILIGLTLWRGDARARRLLGYVACVVVPFMVLISAGGTKLEWYAAPALPLLALAVGCGVHTLVTHILPRYSPVVRRWVAIVGLLLVAAAYVGACIRSYNPTEMRIDRSDFALSYYLRQLPIGDTVLYWQPGYVPHVDFYGVRRQSKGSPAYLANPAIEVVADPEQVTVAERSPAGYPPVRSLAVGDTLLLRQADLAQLPESVAYRAVATHRGVVVVRIEGQK